MVIERTQLAQPAPAVSASPIGLGAVAVLPAVAGGPDAATNCPLSQNQWHTYTRPSGIRLNLPDDLLADPRIVEPRHDDKTRIISNIRRQYNHSLKSGTDDIRQHTIIGPLGARVYDIPLLRALDNWKGECTKTSGISSNIIILAKRDISAQIMARRILAMAEPRERPALADSMEIIQTANPGNAPSESAKPKIYIVPEESLLRSCNGSVEDRGRLKTALEPFAKYTKLNQLRFFYYDKADQMGSDGKKPILDYLLTTMKESNIPGTKEIIQTSYSNNHYGDDTSGIASNLPTSKYQFDSPDVLSRTETAPINRTFNICQTAIGEDIPVEAQVQHANGKTYAFVRDYAHNQGFIQSSVTPIVEKFLNQGAKRIIIRAHDTKSIGLLSSELQKQGIAVGWTQHDETTLKSDSGEKISPARIELIDRFGKDFHVLIHCSILDGEEIPADAVMVFALPEADDQLEAMVSPALTPYPDEEHGNGFKKERELWFLERGKVRTTKPSTTALYDAVQKRHRGNVFQSGRVISVGTIADNVNARHKGPESTSVAAPSKYAIYTRDYGGNPKWLEYLDRELLPGSKSLKLKIIEKAQEMATSNLTSLDEDALVEVLRGLGSGGDLREVLYYGFEDKIDDIVARFPQFTGIKDLTEANKRVAFISRDLLKEADPRWLKLLEQSFGDNNVIQMITDFVYNCKDEGKDEQYKYRSDLSKDDRLEQLISVLIQRQQDFIGNQEKGQRIFGEFLEYLKATGDLHLIASQKLYPERINLATDMQSAKQTARELRYLFASEQIKTEPAWQDELRQALGAIPAQQQDRIADEIADFLFTNEKSRRELYCGDRSKLYQAASTLMGVDLLPEAESQTLRREFFAHINRNGTNPRLAPHIFAARFPGTIDLATNIDTEAKAADFIRSRFNVSVENSNWMPLLDGAIKAHGVDENKRKVRAEAYARFLFSRVDRSTIFSSPETMTNAIRTLQGQRIGDVALAEEQRLFTDFVGFIEREYQYEFQPLVIKAKVKDLFLIEVSDTKDRRKIVEAVAKQYSIAPPDAADDWAQILGQTALVDYIVKHHPNINNPLHAAQALAFYSGAVLTRRNISELKAASNNVKDLQLSSNDLHGFCSFLKTTNPKISIYEIADSAPKPEKFKLADTVRTLTDAKEAIAYATARSPITPNPEWEALLAKVDTKPAVTLVAEYLFSRRKDEPSPFEDKDCLARMMRILLGLGVVKDAQASKEDSKTFKDFYDYLQERYSGQLRPMMVARHVPQYLSCEDIITDKISAYDAIKFLFMRKDGTIADTAFPHFLITASPEIQQRIQLITDFLWDLDSDHNCFKSLKGLRQSISATIGAISKFDPPEFRPVKDESAEDLFVKFYKLLKASYPDIKNYDNYAYLPKTKLMSLVEDIQGVRDIEGLAKAIRALLIHNTEDLHINKKWLTLLSELSHAPGTKIGESALLETIRFLATYLISTYPECITTDDKLKELVAVMADGKQDFQGSEDQAREMKNSLYQAAKVAARGCNPYIADSRVQQICTSIRIDRTAMLEVLKSLLNPNGDEMESDISTATATDDIAITPKRRDHERFIKTTILPTFGYTTMEQLAEYFQVPITTARKPGNITAVIENWAEYTLKTNANNDISISSGKTQEPGIINPKIKDFIKRDMSQRMSQVLLNQEDKAWSLLVALADLVLSLDQARDIGNVNYLYQKRGTTQKLYEFGFYLRANEFVCRFKSSFDNPPHVLEGSYKLQDGRWNMKPEARKLEANALNLNLEEAIE